MTPTPDNRVRRRNVNQPMTAEEVSKFWNKTTKTGVGEDDCWEWTGLKQKVGGTNGVAYGVYARPKDGEQLHAHRFAKMIELGGWNSIPVNPESRTGRTLLVIHKCGNAVCCNPRHLVAGTPNDKARIMKEVLGIKMGWFRAKQWRTYRYTSYQEAKDIWDGKISPSEARAMGIILRTYYHWRINEPNPLTVGAKKNRKKQEDPKREPRASRVDGVPKHKRR